MKFQRPATIFSESYNDRNKKRNMDQKNDQRKVNTVNQEAMTISFKLHHQSLFREHRRRDEIVPGLAPVVNGSAVQFLEKLHTTAEQRRKKNKSEKWWTGEKTSLDASHQ